VAALIDDDHYCAQEKYDGRRLLLRQKGEHLIDINKKGNIIGLPLPVFKVVRGLMADVTLDGEVIGETVYAFDLLELDGVDIRSWPYHKRLAALTNLLEGVQFPALKLVATAFTSAQKLELLQRLKAEKREGIVFKRLAAPYTAGRPNSGGDQLKYKFVATLSALVANINQQRSVAISLLGRNGWQAAGNVTIPANYEIPRVGEVVEVRYLYAHRKSDVLFQPSYLGKRNDVDTRECQVSQLKYKPEASDSDESDEN
jgi:bifunctional non-homologous end joining protein LigD